MSDEAVPELVEVPAEGIPGVVDTPEALAATLGALAAASGPLAVDTERAQGFRYTGRAYLIQLRREGAGTHLLDPIAFAGDRPRADLSAFADVLGDAEWIVHAATQDLPCLAEVGMVPRRLFDTELGGRLLGLPRVALSALTERALGKTLAKEHSASDWSQRPLPGSWLSYAALDVELLVPLRDWVAAELEAAGKAEWAAQEFAWLAAHAADPPAVRTDPWRRTSGLHDVRTPRGLAFVRELWQTRDALARAADRAPGRLLNDRAITELAVLIETDKVADPGRSTLKRVRGFSWRAAARHEADWLDALVRAAALPRGDLPPLKLAHEGPPAPRTWGHRFPEAAARWDAVRPAVVALAEELALPPENLISPDTIRRLAWEPPVDTTQEGVCAFLAAADARPWQRDLVAPVVAPLLAGLSPAAPDR